MLKIFWIFLIFNMVFADEEESNEKYIDLLPEEEKQEFLNRIARRIFEEIQSRDIPNQSNVEINDDQLEAHNEYVQDIINEESRNLKNERRADSDKMGENDKDEHIDLTLRDNKREKRKNTDEGNQQDATQEFSYDVIPVKTVYVEDNYDKETTTTENLENINIIQDTTFSPNSTENTNPENVRDENTNNLRKSQFINITETTEIVDSEPNSYEISSTTDDNDHYEITTTSIDTISSNYNITETWSSTQKIYDHIYEENDSNNEGDSSQNSTETVTDNITVTETTSSSPPFNNETEFIDTKTTLTATDNEDLSTAEIHSYQKFQRSGSELNETSKSLHVEDIVPTTPDILIADTNQNVSVSVKDVDDIKVNTNESIPKNLEETKSTEPKGDSEMINNTKPILRQNSYISEENNVPEINVVISPKKEYRVYEVAADKPPFAKLNKKQGIQITNYAPEYEYNNNDKVTHLVPKQESYENDLKARSEIKELLSNLQKRKKVKTKDLNVHANSILRSPQIRSTFIRYNKKGPNKQFPIKPIPQNIYGFLKPIHKKIRNRNIYYNPYDYMDMDYVNQLHGVNTFRSGIQNDQVYKHFPDSNDEDHPINLIHKSDTVKDHVRAIRHLLYLKKYFGYVPDVHGKRKSDPSKITRLKLDRSKQDPENIAADYYFGRVYSIEDISKADNTTKDKINTERQILEDTDKDFDEEEFGQFFEIIVNVLNDIIRFDNNALIQYDWLKTTVEIQGAIHKLLDLCDKLQNGEVNHEDLELLKYTLYLFKISEMDLEENLVRELPEAGIKKKSKGFLPKIKKINKIKHPVILWKNFAKYIRNIDEVENIFFEFIDFLHKLQFHLDDLHEAIKHIAMISTYKTQNWFKDLKSIYFDKASIKNTGEVILHLGLVSLIDKIDEHAENGAAEDYRSFVSYNKEEVDKVKEDFVFIIQILKQLEKL